MQMDLLLNEDCLYEKEPFIKMKRRKIYKRCFFHKSIRISPCKSFHLFNYFSIKNYTFYFTWSLFRTLYIIIYFILYFIEIIFFIIFQNHLSLSLSLYTKNYISLSLSLSLKSLFFLSKILSLSSTTSLFFFSKPKVLSISFPTTSLFFLSKTKASLFSPSQVPQLVSFSFPYQRLSLSLLLYNQFTHCIGPPKPVDDPGFSHALMSPHNYCSRSWWSNWRPTQPS